MTFELLWFHVIHGTVPKSKRVDSELIRSGSIMAFSGPINRLIYACMPDCHVKIGRECVQPINISNALSDATQPNCSDQWRRSAWFASYCKSRPTLFLARTDRKTSARPLETSTPCHRARPRAQHLFKYQLFYPRCQKTVRHHAVCFRNWRGSHWSNACWRSKRNAK
jgi:hypothetical protein